MNSFKTSPLLQCVAAACIVGGATSPAVAQFATPNLPSTPNDGVVCRSGYAPNFNAGVLKCFKSGEILVALACPDPRFPDLIVRARAGGTPEGLDVCDKSGGVTITSSNDIKDFVKGRDYEFAKKDDAKITERVAAQRQTEASALGVGLGDVEVDIVNVVTDTQSGDSTDKSKVTLRFFTFAAPTNGRLQGPIGQPATVNSTSAFAPRPLPR